MAYGRPANVRSHRRGARERRRRFAPWISVTLVCLLVAAGLGFGYQQLLAQTCSGQQTARVVASPSTAGLLSTFATDWAQREPATSEGTCARVVVTSRDSAETAAALAVGWETTGDEPPDVWVPASTAWAQRAAVTDEAEPLLPDLRPSIARSPTVIAMPEPMAIELDWPDTRLATDPGEETELNAGVRWESLLEEFSDDEQGWDRFGREEWGPFRFGMSNPARDTAGLLALTAIVDANETGETSREELEAAFNLHRLLDPELYHETTEQLLTALRSIDNGGEQAALQHISAFPALEKDVLDYNRGNPSVPLAAIYPTNGNMEADHPYLILNGEWVDEPTREVAQLFLEFVRSEEPQQTLRKAGFRGTNREAGDDFTEEYGVVPQLVALPRAVLVPDSVTLAIDRWTALARTSNVLIAFDVSGSMLLEIPGTGETRMQRAQQAAIETMRLFTEEDRVGFWEFSTALDGDRDHRSLVPLGTLGDTMEDGRTRREHIIEAAQFLEPVGDTGLYNTIQAAYDTVLGNYDPDAINMVVIITDGEDDTGGRPGISLPELLEYLDEAPGEDQEVRVINVAFGEEPNFEVLAEISDATGGEAHYSSDGFDLVELLRTAVFSVES
ncbi:VWA domain-containing protein [Natronosporangium hydrolyticum]|uniref:VWA domain-containing protein n=1 Tax=Natronosporangium hydrolyticum TaxID=2811111 RepID=A0A895YG11_9ACTN|nr:substrate-binding and VWA domain-containing protein [Natronosporangium hydrolyticum]QSB12608.1 VWA domain-containing protein [Natronosporangium hydrolyticum]